MHNIHVSSTSFSEKMCERKKRKRQEYREKYKDRSDPPLNGGIVEAYRKTLRDSITFGSGHCSVPSRFSSIRYSPRSQEVITRPERFEQDPRRRELRWLLAARAGKFSEGMAPCVPAGSRNVLLVLACIVSVTPYFNHFLQKLIFLCTLYEMERKICLWQNEYVINEFTLSIRWRYMQRTCRKIAQP